MTANDVELVRASITNAYVVVASATILVYDYLRTLEDEISFVWNTPNPRLIATALFLVNRYLPFVETFVALHRLTTIISPERCLVQVTVVTWCAILGTALAEVILLLRTYAIWGRKKSIRIVFILPIVAFLSCIPITILQARSYKYAPPPLPKVVGCYLESASNLIYIDYVMFMLSEAVILALTLIKAIPAFRHPRSRFIQNMYRDGILFYIYLLLVSVANVVIPILAPMRYMHILSIPQRVLHSILCTRVLLVRVSKDDACVTMSEDNDSISRMRRHGEQGLIE